VFIRTLQLNLNDDCAVHHCNGTKPMASASVRCPSVHSAVHHRETEMMRATSLASKPRQALPRLTT